MKLDQLIKSKRLVILGLNSGTSADSLDLAAIEISRATNVSKIKFIDGCKSSYPELLRNEIINMVDGQKTTLEKIIYLDQALGKFYGQKARAFIKRLNENGITVNAIASHGQTIRHLPQFSSFANQKVRGTLQLGSAEQIATLCGKVVIADFRQADIALGNEGAPITTVAMGKLFSDKKESRLIINIGGMSNYFWFPTSKRSNFDFAADCGPGNSLSDILSEKLYKQKYDKNGLHALAGSVSVRLLSLLEGEANRQKSTISTGRERYGIDLSERVLDFRQTTKLPANDLIATVAEFTVQMIYKSIRKFLKELPPNGKLYLTGGGVHNKFFIRRLNELVNSRKVASISQLGFNPDLVEASAFAVMGELALKGMVSKTKYDLKKVQNIMPVSGRIIQPPSTGLKDL